MDLESEFANFLKDEKFTNKHENKDQKQYELTITPTIKE